MLLIFSTPVLLTHLWQLKTLVLCIGVYYVLFFYGKGFIQRWVGPNFFGFGSGSGFILRARALSGLKKLLNKSGFIRARARALLRPAGSGFGSYLLKSPSPSPNFGLGLRPDPSLVLYMTNYWIKNICLLSLVSFKPYKSLKEGTQ